MKGRYPVCCLFLELNPAEVDVNIHPAKREVKFHAERQVRGLVTQAVRRALLAFHAGSQEPEVGSHKPETGSQKPSSGGRTPGEAGSRTTLPAVAFSPETTPFENFPIPPANPSKPGEERRVRVPAAWATGRKDPKALFPVRLPPPPSTAIGPTPSVPATGAAPAPEMPEPALVLPASPALSSAGPPSPTALLNVPLRLVGVIGRLYVLFESDRGLVLVDQHAAHERILFEQMLARLEQGDAPSQRLLLAETVELSARDAAFLRPLLPALTRLGVGLREFGERTFLLDGLPPFARVTNARQFVLELIDALKSAGAEVNSLRLGEDDVAKTVCRHAVKANDPLQGRELENLVEDLRRCAMPYTCPHGRPTIIELSFRELEKKFGRSA
jgi:DNA mismatch repair protein MutL